MTLTATSIANNFSRSTFKAHAEEYKEVLSWMKGLGLRIEPTRAAIYAKVLSSLVEAYEKGDATWGDMPYSFGETLTAMGEINELLRIHRGMKDVNEPELLAKLKRVISGRFGRTEAETGDPARDYAFELMIASRFRQGGYDISLKGQADLTVRLGNDMLFVECKRLRSIEGVRKNVREAIKQLHRRYRKGKAGQWGLIALSITDGANPEQKMLARPSHDDISESMSRKVDVFISDYCRLWQGARDAHLLGAMVEFAVAGVMEDHNLPITCVETGFNNAHTPEALQTRLLWEIANRLRSKVGETGRQDI